MNVPLHLIEAAKTGPAGIEPLLEAVWPDTFRLAQSVTGNRESAQDAAQDACVALLRNIGSLENAHAFRTWWYRIVLREALKQQRKRPEDALDAADAPYTEDRAGIVDLWRALRALNVPLRTVIVLHYFEGLPTRDIAAILRVPDATVRFRLMTARRRLEPLLRVRESSSEPKGENLYAL